MDVDGTAAPDPPWIPSLPKTLASGAAAPALKAVLARGFPFRGDFARFARAWKKLESGANLRIAIVGGSITAGAGRTDLAVRMLEAGGTALWEDWWTGASRNHVMFCDFAAWVLEFLLPRFLPGNLNL